MARKNELTVNFDEVLEEDLKDPEFAAEFLNAHLSYDDELGETLFLEAMAKLIEAHGQTQFSKSTKIARPTLYKAFSNGGNPTLSTLKAALDEIGVILSFKPKKATS